jgi:hypothetical protein
MSNIDYRIISSFREFIENVKTLNEGQQYLKKVRNTTIGTYSLKDSRCIWMTLMIYKFKNDMDANDILWTKSRSIILAILKRDNELNNTIEDFLTYFNDWKANDYQQFVTDIACFYYNILQIKKSIELHTQNTDSIIEETTRNEWQPHYDELIQTIRTSCSKIGCLTMLDNIIIQMEEQKYNTVAEIMQRAYWDKIEKDIEGGNYDIIYSNLSELKTFLYEILPKNTTQNTIDKFIDIDFIKQRVKHDVFDHEYLLSLMTYILDFLCEWDAQHFRERYIKEKKYISELTNVSFPKLIRTILEKSFLYTMDLKNRKGIWKKILENPSN